MVVKDEGAECTAVANFVRARLDDGISASEIALLVRSQGQLGRARAAVAKAGEDPREEAGVAIRTMHDAKGLEFKAVAVMACDEDVLPDPARLADIGDMADLDAAYETERHLLYVACTRARDYLLITAIAPGSEFLSDFGIA
jgi:superfamily I DNA/RNA helicase